MAENPPPQPLLEMLREEDEALVHRLLELGPCEPLPSPESPPTADEPDDTELTDEPELLVLEEPVETEPGTADSVTMYLREIARIALLTAEQEVVLGRLITTGQESREELRHGPVLPARRRRLARQVQRGEEARARLVRANLRLVVSIAKRYLGTGLSLGDLIQEGSFGILRAAEKFDYRRGFKFSTYATWWIRQSITRAITEHSRAIRLPAYMADQVRRQGYLRQQLQQTMGREPTSEEVALELDLITAEDRAAIEHARRGGSDLPSGLRDELRRAVARVELLAQVAQEPLSLEAPIGEGEDNVIGDYLGDGQSATLLDSASQTLLEDQMRGVLEELSERERIVLEMRFGLNGSAPRTLEDIGDVMGISRERVRQIEAKALRKLRQPSRSNRLRDYLS
ncbi:MAG: sigma-70 family RNA polymerase sigma factor [Anaerolineae bacterium]